MKTAIIVAFDYNIFPRQINSISKLFGTKYDINNAISIAQNLKIKNSNIYVISDVKEFKKADTHSNINFSFYNFANFKQLLVDLYSLVQISEQVFFYLNGHGELDVENSSLKHKCFVAYTQSEDFFSVVKIPTKTLIDVLINQNVSCLRIYQNNKLTIYNSLRGVASFDLSNQKKHSTSKIFAIIDTCFSENMLGLKYKYKQGFQDINVFPANSKAVITSITSMQNRGVSMSRGSDFTNNLMYHYKKILPEQTLASLESSLPRHDTVINSSYNSLKNYYF